MHCECASNYRFSFSQLFDMKVLQKVPNNAGMGSLPEVCSEDANVRGT